MSFPVNEAAPVMAYINKLGRNDKCWCGSDKKYKHCHLDRETQSPPTKQETLINHTRMYERGSCLHPDAGSSKCKGKTVKCHTIQRNGGLSRIARNGHVYTLINYGRMFDDSKWSQEGGPKLVGVRDASTFTGFCNHHDNELFAPLEKSSFEGSPLQIALLGYRTICQELYLKERALEISKISRDLDKGRPLLEQYQLQRMNHWYKAGVLAALKELRKQKQHYDSILFENRLDYLNYYVAEFDSRPEVMCSGINQATHDFRGNQLDDLTNMNSESDWHSFSLIATDYGGAAVFCWPADHSNSEAVIRSLHALPDTDLPHALVRFTFEFFENTYFEPDWWDGLGSRAQMSLKQRQLRGLIDFGDRPDFERPDNCLLDDGIRAVDWPVVSRVTSFTEK